MVQPAPHSGTIPSKALQAAVDAIKAVTDLLPDDGTLTTLLTNVASILLDTGTTIPGLLTAIQGAGWTNETLKAIKDAVDAVIPGVGDATQAKQDAIEAKLDDGVSGLAALKTLIDILTAYVDTEVAAILLDTGTTLPATLATIAGYIDTEIAAIETKLDGASGLAAIKVVVDAILVDTNTTLEAKLDAIKAITDALPDAGALTTLQTAVTGIQNDLDNATDGLGALKLLIDAVQATSNTIEGYTDILDDAANGLANIKSLIDTLQGTANTIEGYTDILDDAVNGLANIKSLIDTMQGNVTDILLDTGTTIPGTITTLQTTATGIQNDLDNATDGLGALKALIDTLQGNVTDILADTGELQTDWADGGRLDLLIDAITTHLTDIKGAGWTNETLKAIKDAVDAIIPGVGDATQAKQDAIEAKLDIPANFMADLTTLEARLSAIRAGYLDQLDFNLQEKLNEIDAEVEGIGGVAMRGTDNAALAASWTAALATALAAYTAVRGGYLDQLDFNLQEAIALQATVAKQDIIDGIVDAIKISTDKLAGATPGVGAATQNWNAAENDIVSIGANDTKNKLHSLLLDISALTATATISIRMYMQVNGVEKKVYDQDFIVGTDPDGLWIVNGTVGIHEVLRVTAQSDNAGDDGKAIAYDYMLEVM